MNLPARTSSAAPNPSRLFSEEDIATVMRMHPDEFFSPAYLRDKAHFPWSARHSSMIGTIGIALKHAGIETIGALCELTEARIRSLFGGTKTQQMLIDALGHHGLSPVKE